MQDFNRAVGYRIAAAIARASISQRDLAEHLGQKPNVVSYWCSGTRTPNAQQIAEIGRFLNVSADYLLGLTDVASVDTDVNNAALATGLTEEGVSTLASSSEARFFADAVLSYPGIGKLADAFRLYFELQAHMRPDITKEYPVVEAAAGFLPDAEKNALHDSFAAMENALLTAQLASAQFRCEVEFRHLLETFGGVENGKHNPSKE